MDRIVNFLNPIFETSIKCNAVLDDFYLPENLISSDRRKFDLGFMAYRVQKPPMHLEFELMCHIDLHCVKLWPKLDSLKSISFEVHVDDGSKPDSAYVKVGNCYNLIEDGVIFERCSPTQKVISDNFVSNEHNFRRIPFFRSSSLKTMSQVKRVKISITQTARCTPVLKRIEIWGRISRNTSDKRRQAVLQLLSPKHINNGPEKTVIKAESTERDREHVLNGVEIPEEFLDSITYEVMSLPMVLPSGKIIDMSTLNKHNEQEEKWGRMPSDPYTGQPFTDIRKPVLNTALKSQIDKFLLQNGHLEELSKIPRTVGTTSLNKRRIEISAENSVSGPSNSNKRVKTDSHVLAYSCYSNQTSSMETSAGHSVHLPSTSSSQSTLSTIIERQSMSLDERVQMALETINKYSKSNTNEQKIDKCFQCDNGQETNFYKIKLCLHLICRNCLVNKSVCNCKCGSKFNNVDLEKYHKRTFL